MTALTRLAKLKELAQAATLSGRREIEDVSPHQMLALIKALEECVDTIYWISQTVHQAHHESGMATECPKNSCQAAMAQLERIEKLLGDKS